MGYLDPTEYQAYGISPDTTDDWITLASTVIDRYCRRETLAVTQYTERLRIVSGSPSVQLSFTPLVAVAPSTTPFMTVQGRYGKPRRGELLDPLQDIFLTAFSIPGTWVGLDPSQLDWAPDGVLTLYQGFLGTPLNELQVTYTAGLSTIPDAVKSACALIIKNAQATPGMNVKASRLDMMQVQYFSDSLVDSTVRLLLRPWVANRLG